MGLSGMLAMGVNGANGGLSLGLDLGTGELGITLGGGFGYGFGAGAAIGPQLSVTDGELKDGGQKHGSLFGLGGAGATITGQVDVAVKEGPSGAIETGTTTISVGALGPGAGFGGFIGGGGNYTWKIGNLYAIFRKLPDYLLGPMF